MNLPNKLTLMRLGITVLFVVSLSLPLRFGATAALAFFVVASITDYLDGQIARRCNLITDFGKLMDPLADKILTASAFICLMPYVPAWAVIIIIAREFLITGLRLLAGTKGSVLPAERLGKHKTAWQMVTIIFYLLLLSTDDFPGLLPPQMREFAFSTLGPVLIGIAVVLTVYSGGAYFWKNRSLIAP